MLPYVIAIILFILALAYLHYRMGSSAQSSSHMTMHVLRESWQRETDRNMKLTELLFEKQRIIDQLLDNEDDYDDDPNNGNPPPDPGTPPPSPDPAATKGGAR